MFRNCTHPAIGLLIAVFTLSSCKKDETPGKAIDVFYKSMSTLEMEVAYEVGAEPYTTSVAGGNTWGYTELNIESLFVQRPIALDVTVPDGLGEMSTIPDQNKSGFTVDNIIGLANHYRKNTGNEADGNIFILFLDGYFQKDNTLQQNVMGVNVTGTTVVAIFKPVITAMRGALIFREYAEQSVIIHEIGHALGLVNLGLPLTSAHEDEPHEGHCTNTKCVMYWANEGTDIASFVQNFGSNKKLIFGDECVWDVKSYAP